MRVALAVTAILVWACMTIAVRASGMIFMLVILFAAWLGWVGIVIALLIWVSVPAAAFLWSIQRACQRRWCSAASWVAIPCLAVIMFVWGQEVTGVVRFIWNKPTYDREVASAHANRCVRAAGSSVDAKDCSSPVAIAFEWDGFLNSWNGLIYDETDQIALQPEQRSPAWKAGDVGSMMGCSSADLALGGHYYLASGNYC